MQSTINQHTRFLHVAWAVLPFLTASCGGSQSPTDPEPPVTVLEVTASVSGEDRDLNGYTVTLDGSQSRPIGGADNPNTSSFGDVTPSSHELELSELTDNCQVSGENPRTVTVTDGQTTATTFELTCTRTVKVAFVRSDQIFVIQADGQDPFQVTGDAFNLDEYGWEWSPDGTEIAYTATSGAVIAVANANGAVGARRLTEPQSIDPAWSPDGTRIVFQSNRTGDANVWIVKADATLGGGTNLTATPPTGGLDPTWSPDGSRISFTRFGTGSAAIWTMAPNGSNKTVVIEETEFVAVGNPAWNPDGSRIAFLASEDGVTGEIWIVASDGSDLRQLTTDAGLRPESLLQWTPDGARIAFHSERTGDPEIWVVDADGSNLTNLTDDPAADRDPAWSPDGSQILFSSDRSGVRAIWIMSADGSNLRQITEDAEANEDAAPTWRPRR